MGWHSSREEFDNRVIGAMQSRVKVTKDLGEIVVYWRNIIQIHGLFYGTHYRLGNETMIQTAGTPAQDLTRQQGVASAELRVAQEERRGHGREKEKFDFFQMVPYRHVNELGLVLDKGGLKRMPIYRGDRN